MDTFHPTTNSPSIYQALKTEYINDKKKKKVQVGLGQLVGRLVVTGVWSLVGWQTQGNSFPEPTGLGAERPVAPPGVEEGEQSVVGVTTVLDDATLIKIFCLYQADVILSWYCLLVAEGSTRGLP